jgi:hypothetical protein
MPIYYINDVLTEIKVHVLITSGNTIKVNIIHNVTPKTNELKKLIVITLVVGTVKSAISL